MKKVIRPNKALEKSHFWVRGRAFYVWGENKRKKEEGRRRREGKPRYGTLYGIIVWKYGNFGKDACLEILLENTCLS